MKDGRLELRVPGDELEQWRALAEDAGMSLSEWVRARCATDVELVAPADPDPAPDPPVEQVSDPPGQMPALLHRPPKGSAWSPRGWAYMLERYGREPTEQEWERYKKQRL